MSPSTWGPWHAEALAWPARVLFPAGLRRLPQACHRARRALRIVLAATPLPRKTMVPGHGHALPVRHGRRLPVGRGDRQSAALRPRAGRRRLYRRGAPHGAVAEIFTTAPTSRPGWRAGWCAPAPTSSPRRMSCCPCRCTGWRFFSRRFNQSAELARAIAALSGKPFAPNAIVRVKMTRQQVGLGASRAPGQCPRRVPGAAGTRHRRARPARAAGRRCLHHRRDRLARSARR